MYVVIFVTAKDKKEAKKIALNLVEAKLAACVNIIINIESIFRWEGKVDSSKEALLVIKTKKSLLKRVEKRVRSIHSYSLPEIIALPIIAGQADYLKWINSSVIK